jgi:hypothetical protein
MYLSTKFVATFPDGTDPRLVKRMSRWISQELFFRLRTGEKFIELGFYGFWNFSPDDCVRFLKAFTQAEILFRDFQGGFDEP